MPGIFFLADDLAPDGPAAVLPQIAPPLAQRFRVGVGVLSRPTGAVDDALVAAGLTPGTLPGRGLLDLAGLRQARKWVSAFGPTVIHAIGPKAAWVAAVLRLPRVGLARRPAAVVSGVADGGPLTAWAVRSADRVIAETASEMGQARRFGVPPARFRFIRPGISPAVARTDPAAFRRGLDVPPAGRLIVAAGRFDAASDLRSAVWAFDVVKYVVPDLHLVLVGDGPERPRVERFARSLGFDDYRVRFAGPRADLASVLGLAEVVWVTHRRGGVRNALLAMASGRPVVGFGTAELTEVITDGKTGRLVPVGDRVRLAAATAELLDSPDAAGAVGRAGQEFADAYAAVYHELTTG
jgi:glycosyltransferase involved in cell wall biosynthesis